MKTLLLILSLTICCTLQAQFVVQDSFEIFGSVGDKDVGPYFPILNSSDTMVDFYWRLVKDDDFPRDWEISVCDKILCWETGQEVSDCEDPGSLNTLDSEEEYSLFKVGLKSKDGITTKGKHSAMFYLTKVCDNIEDESVITEIHFTFEVSGGVATYNIYENTIHEVFPNPSQTQISISNDESIAAITLLTLSGHQLSSTAHTPGMHHDISILESGMYLMELRDNQQRLIGVEKIMKVD